jgi:hypothetical protein
LSLSINLYNNNPATRVTQSESNDSASSRQPVRRPPPPVESSTTEKTDSVELSPELMEYLAGYQSSSPVSTGNYGDELGGNTLTNDQKKQFLIRLEESLDAAGSLQTSEAEGNTEADPLSIIQSGLSGFDSETATEEQISDLFDEIMEILESPRPPEDGGTPPPPPPSDSDNSGLPPLMKAMGRSMPPPAWSISGTGVSDEAGTGSSQSVLTTDQKKALLSDIQTKLSPILLPETDEKPTSTASVLTQLRSELSGFDAGTASEEDVSGLFDKVIDTLKL